MVLDRSHSPWPWEILFGLLCELNIGTLKRVLHFWKRFCFSSWLSHTIRHVLYVVHETKFKSVTTDLGISTIDWNSSLNIRIVVSGSNGSGNVSRWLTTTSYFKEKHFETFTWNSYFRKWVKKPIRVKHSHLKTFILGLPNCFVLQRFDLFCQVCTLAKIFCSSALNRPTGTLPNMQWLCTNYEHF